MTARALLFSLCTAALAAACGSSPLIVGTVLDAEGRPLAGAEVRTEPATDIRQTNDKGRFYIAGVLGDDAQPAPLEAGTYRLIVMKLPDYEDSAQTIEVEGETRVTVRLREKQADVGPAVAPEPLQVDPRAPDHPDVPVDGT